mmetsp:Transcript_70834/g.189021  ORF Transcript_70834/g.189021 Transcript_70834/m.189021 type:complete len:300 (-) Transcript_70834:661-1560(-)
MTQMVPCKPCPVTTSEFSLRSSPIVVAVPRLNVNTPSKPSAAVDCKYDPVGCESKPRRMRAYRRFSVCAAAKVVWSGSCPRNVFLKSSATRSASRSRGEGQAVLWSSLLSRSTSAPKTPATLDLSTSDAVGFPQRPWKLTAISSVAIATAGDKHAETHATVAVTVLPSRHRCRSNANAPADGGTVAGRNNSHRVLIKLLISNRDWLKYPDSAYPQSVPTCSTPANSVNCTMPIRDNPDGSRISTDRVTTIDARQALDGSHDASSRCMRNPNPSASRASAAEQMVASERSSTQTPITGLL